MKRIGLDVDGVCLDFAKSFISLCKVEGIHLTIGNNYNFFNEDASKIFKNLPNAFWNSLNREPKSLDLSFVPYCYISHRNINTDCTIKSLKDNGFKNYDSVLHVDYTEQKYQIIKEQNIDIFIDDRASTITYLLESGVEAYLLDQVWNRQYNLPRLMSLGELYV